MSFESELNSYDPEIQELILSTALERVIEREYLESSLSAFVRGCSGTGEDGAWGVVEPGKRLRWNWHLDIICYYLERLFERTPIKIEGYDGPFTRLAVNVPFRTMKSTLISVCYPAWIWAKNSAYQFLTVSYAEQLATRDALKTRNLLESDWFKERWPKVILANDQNEKRNYWTTNNGYRNSVGINAGITGKGGDLVILDDPQDSELVQSDAERQNTLDAYDSKIVTRLNDPALSAIVLVQQRLHEKDMTGHVLEKEKGWVLLRFPMRYDPELRYESPFGPDYEDRRTKPDDLLWPERFPDQIITRLVEVLGPYQASGQLQQSPSPAGGGIIRREWWHPWPSDRPLPECLHVFVSWDTAFTERDMKRADKTGEPARSAVTVWGVFRNPLPSEHDRLCMMLLWSWADWLDYHDLRAKALEIQDRWKPDNTLVEKKATGISLLQDLRRADVLATEYQPDVDKVARAYAVQPLFSQGLIWYRDKPHNTEVIEECARFPRGTRKDYVDTATQACLYVRNSFLLENGQDHVPKADVGDEGDEPPVKRLGSWYLSRPKQRGLYDG